MAAAFDPYHKWLAIPPEDQPPNHYRLLALTLYESDPDVIANATDQRMTHIKSFQSGKHSAASQKLLNEIAKAKVCLLNAEKKAEYDQALREKLAPVVAKPAPVRVAKPAEIAPASGTETISLLNRLHEKVQPWHIIAAAAAGLVLLLVVAVIFLLGDGPEEVAETEPRNTQGEPNPPVPLPPEVVARPPDTEPKPLETEPEPPPEVPVTPPDTEPKPPDIKPEPPPEIPVEPPAPEPEPFLSGEALTKAIEQFDRSLSQASTPADLKAVAQKGLTLLDHAIVDGNHELAKKTAAAALSAARRAEDGELSRKTTLRFLDVQKPLTESMKEEARKRLNTAGRR